MIDLSDASASGSERAGGRSSCIRHADAGGHGGADQFLKRRMAGLLEHQIAIAAQGTEVTAAEIGGFGHGADWMEDDAGAATHPA